MLRVISRYSIREYASLAPRRQVNYLRPILFGVASTTTIFIMAAVVHEKESETFWRRLKKRTDGPQWSNLMDLIRDDRLFVADVWEERRKMWVEKKEETLEKIKKTMETYQNMPLKIRQGCYRVVQSYLSLTEAEKTVAGLMMLHVLVFSAWKVPSMRPFMTQWFVHNPTSGHSITLLTSTFFHRDAIHLTLNMVLLWSLGPSLYQVLGREQFMALYLSMGIGSNLISHLLSTSLRHSRPIVPMVASSATTYGILAGTTYLHPEYSLFVPMLPIPINISYALPALVSMDLLSLGLRWRRYDHVAHMAGAGLGWAYMEWGPLYLWPYLLKLVRDIKKSGGGDDENNVLMEMPRRFNIRIYRKKTVTEEQ